jgi:recombinational DNA repair protein RecT
MAMKTVLRRLLSKYGLLSIEMQNALDCDTIPTSENLRDEVVNQPKVTFDAQVITDNVQDAQAEELKQPDLGSLND